MSKKIDRERCNFLSAEAVARARLTGKINNDKKHVQDSSRKNQEEV
jgi:hypothetical protein